MGTASTIQIGTIRLRDRLYEASDILCDACELVWTTYGVRSKAGRIADRLVHHTNLVDFICQDLAEAAGHRLRSHRTPSEEANRYGVSVRRPRSPLPRRLDFALHQRVGLDLKRARDLVQDVYIKTANEVGKRSSAARYTNKLLKDLEKFRCELDNSVSREYPRRSNAEVCGCYYGERDGDPAPVVALDRK